MTYDDRVEQLLEDILTELDALQERTTRTETRLCTLANHLGAKFVGAPTRTNYPRNHSREYHHD